MGYHTTKGVLKVMRPSRLRFKPTDFLVKLHVERIIGNKKSVEDIKTMVPNIGNLQEVVEQEVIKIKKEAEERREKERKEAEEREKQRQKEKEEREKEGQD